MEKDNEVYVSAHYRVCFEDGDSTNSFYTENELRETIGEAKLEKLKSDKQLFWSTYGVTEDGPAYALEDFDNEADAKAKAEALNTEFAANAPAPSEAEVPVELKAAAESGEIAADQLSAATTYYAAFKSRADHGYGFGEFADENIDLVLRRFKSLTEEERGSNASIARAAIRDMNEIAEENSFFSRGMGL
jgi:hypothetical protein